MHEVSAKLDDVAAALIQADVADPQSLTELRDQLHGLAELLHRHGQAATGRVARNAAGLLDQGLQGSGPDASTVLRTLSQAIVAFQVVFRDGRPFAHSEFPAALLEGVAPPPAELPAAEAPAPAPEPEPEPAPAAPTGTTRPPQKLSAAPEDRQLMADFLTETREHLEAADRDLLTLETEPTQNEALNSLFRVFHSIKGVASFFDLQDITTLAHESENLLDRARKGELVLTGIAMDASFASVDALKRQTGLLEKALAAGTDLDRDPALDNLLAAVRMAQTGAAPGPAPAPAPAPTPVPTPVAVTPVHGAPAPPPPAPAAAAPAAEVKAPEEVIPFPGDREPAPAPRAEAAEAAPGPSASRPPSGEQVTAKETVRVDRERLDKLVDAIGELVIAESMVHQAIGAHQAHFSGVSRKLTQLYKITRELQELSLSLRMVPVRATLQKMARLVRDLSKKLGKEIDFHTEGEDTELDKTVVDQIGDPLVHIIRNSIDHGIEPSAEQRLKAGKPARGQVTVRAFHQGGNIYIEVEDDGRGLDRAVILAKARERGLVREDESLSDREVCNLIFLPGFSTAKQITDVSGRGVGMDVVKRNIEALRGSVEIRSEQGKGSVISMRLPLTLAIIDGMVVRLGGNRYIIPTASIVELLRPGEADVATIIGRGEMLTVRDQLVPLFRVGSLFGIDGTQRDATRGTVIVVEDDQQLAGLLVDEIVGQQQVVIKSLGATLEGVNGLAGGAVMPDGRVGLIVDIHGLLSLVRPCREIAA